MVNSRAFKSRKRGSQHPPRETFPWRTPRFVPSPPPPPPSRRFFLLCSVEKFRHRPRRIAQMEYRLGHGNFHHLPRENFQREEWRDLLKFFKRITNTVLSVYTPFNVGGVTAAFAIGESNVIKAVIILCAVVFYLSGFVAQMVIHAGEMQPSDNAIDKAAFMVFILIEYIVPFSGLLLCKLVHVHVSIVCTVGPVLAIVIFICWCFTIKYPMVFVKYIPCIAREALTAGQELTSRDTVSPAEDPEGQAHQSVATQQSPERQGHAVHQAVATADTRTASTEL